MADNAADISKIIEIPLNKLKSFDVVKDQFADLGVLFDNVFVLQPSNSIYFPEVGKMVLMGAPRNGWLEITFTVPVNYFACRLTSSQHSVIKAYDCDDQLLTMFDTETADYEAADPLVSAPPPNIAVEMQASSIERITLSSLDGQLVVHDVRFGF
ncbi:MAG: hypothetical protein WBB82_14020 [Limnothrix sp.]